MQLFITSIEILDTIISHIAQSISLRFVSASIIGSMPAQLWQTVWHVIETVQFT